MEFQENNNDEYYTIDVFHILGMLWKRVWLLIICGLLAAGVAFSIAAYVIPPKYSSSIKLYVNNSNFSLGNTSFSISSSELSAAQSLVSTYGEILKSRSTLEYVISRANVSYTWKELSDLIEYAPCNDTEIMRVTVTCEDPYEASKIANTIAAVLPERIAEIINRASMEVVDSAIPDGEKVSPSISKYTIIGFIIGVFIASFIVIIDDLLDDTVHDEEFILKNYGLPILGTIPDLLSSGSKGYGYSYSKYSYSEYKQK